MVKQGQLGKALDSYDFAIDGSYLSGRIRSTTGIPSPL